MMSLKWMMLSSLASEYWIKKENIFFIIGILYDLHIYWVIRWCGYHNIGFQKVVMYVRGHNTYFKWPDKSYRVLTIWTLLVSEKEIIYTFLDQLAVECIFCLACIRFVKCCPPEGLKGLGLPSLVLLYTLI